MGPLGWYICGFFLKGNLSHPTWPLFCSTCSDEAPAKTVAEQTAALASQHGKAFAENAMGSFGVSSSNVACFGFWQHWATQSTKRPFFKEWPINGQTSEFAIIYPHFFCISEAKRFHDRLVNRFGLSLRIPISEYVHSEGPLVATFPYLAPREVLKHLLLNGYSWLLLGGCHESNDDVETLLRSFWRCYQKEHPEHKVFEHPDRLGTTFPVTVHGDGGRTQKRQPLEVFSLQPVLGLNTAASTKTMACCCDTSATYGGTDLGAPESQCLNSKHSTYLTHFLLFAYPSKSYSQFDDLLTGFLTEILDDLALCCQEGIALKSGKTYYPACIGFKLDMEWMSKAGTLTRSYQNVGYVREIPCCHECDAGSPGVPFEDTNDDALWIPTRFNTVPWQQVPPWRSIPFDDGKPAKFLRRDAFHIFRMGIGRNFLGSCVFLLIYMGCS